MDQDPSLRIPAFESMHKIILLSDSEGERLRRAEGR